MTHNIKFSSSCICFIIVLLAATSCAASEELTPTIAPTVTSTVTPTVVVIPILLPFEEQSTCETVNCWQGITPGVTTFSDAQLLLEAQYGSENITNDRGYISWEIDLANGFNRGSLDANAQGIVRGIDVFFSEGRLSAAQLINWIGEPSIVYIARAFTTEVLCTGGAHITYPNQGIVAYLYSVDSSLVGVSPTQSVVSLEFLTLEDAERWSITDHFVLEWQGYTDYCHLASLTPPPPWMRP